MNRPVVVFVRVNGKPEYEAGAQRWLASYRHFKPEMPHDLLIINRYAYAPDDSFDGLGATEVRYDGGGWDCGSWRFAARLLPDAPLLVCFNSTCRIQSAGWLEAFAEALERNGLGLYGPLASYEICSHIRTPCMAFAPQVAASYPEEVNSREDTYRFEVFGYPSGVPNFSQWAQQQGYPVRLVTRDGDYAQPEWRTPPGIFRRGAQDNLWVHDKHCDAYSASDAENKERLERLADGR